MTYLIYYVEDVVGCYQTLDLVRFNLLVIIYRLFNEDKINRTAYNTMVTNLEQSYFKEENFEKEKFRVELEDAELKVEKIHCEDDGFYAFQNIKTHVKERFDQLEEIMGKDARITVTVPGRNALNHELGKMYYKDWHLLDSKNCDEMTQELYEDICTRLTELVRMFEKRVKFGDVSYQNASETSYQLWSANAVNFDLPEGSMIPGSYQAQEMRFQEKGVFGIVVTPRYGYKNLRAHDFDPN